MITRTVLFFFLGVGSLTAVSAQSEASKILGTWEDPEHQVHMEIYEENGAYLGKVVWLKEPLDPQGNPKKDKNNPNASLQDREIMGMVMLTGLKYKNGKWTGGSMYAPKRGVNVSCKAEIKTADKLILSVSKGIFSKNTTWTRIK